ncbi:hypothetical protein PAGU1678_05190 [Paraclostridium bifermentans subsp. muricolitidis]|nr:hypothetical protein PAGU1678_05190 [Paraclostridium bifermentans subsp. muricolitidis]
MLTKNYSYSIKFSYIKILGFGRKKIFLSNGRSRWRYEVARRRSRSSKANFYVCPLKLRVDLVILSHETIMY